MPAHFGLDLSPSSIKLIEAQKQGDKFLLKAFGEVVTPVNLYSKVERDQALITASIKKLVVEARVSTKDVVVALPNSQVYSQVIQMPPIPEEELSRALTFEAEQYIPIPIERVQIEHIILRMPPKGVATAKMEVLLIAAQKEMVDQVTAIITRADLTPLILETEMLAITRVLLYQLRDDGILIDMGQTSTDFTIIAGGVIRQSNNFETGSEALTRSLASSLSLSLEQAERYKRTYGLDRRQLEGKVAQAIIDPLALIVDQIKRSIDVFKQSNPDVNLTRVIVSGGGALMPGLTAFLAERLGMEILIADPFLGFVRDNNFPLPLVQAASRFATAVGLAIREV